ncbi:hypothetical protein [Nocardia sp. NPDC058114]|uniref:hypothetical protein n=1 Tax=Nocardia sp. NPDC058114 TaxID=3346346 RepID=UPI0036D9EFDB
MTVAGKPPLDKLAELAAGDPARRIIAEQQIARARCLVDHATSGDLTTDLDPTTTTRFRGCASSTTACPRPSMHGKTNSSTA